MDLGTFNAIKHMDEKELTVVWDLGRRCTYDCSYCTPHYHTKHSPFVSKETFHKTADSIVKYADVLNKYRAEPVRTNLSFTGGEATMTPGFFDMAAELRQKYPDREYLGLGLTTNGAYSKRNVLKVIDTFCSVTISYHAEATPEQKKLVLDNINTCKEKDFPFKVNLMMHRDYFEECKDLADYFTQQNIKFVPRIIGDGVATEDTETTQVYNEEQLAWFRNFWQRKNQVTNDCGSCSSKTNASIGRPCCRMDNMHLKFGETWQPGFFVPSQNYNQWHCMINWFFLHVNSEFDYFTFHQTCEVNINSKIGRNGKASQMDLFTDKIENYLKTNTMPIVKCPKSHCGCGLCASKALDKNDLAQTIKEQYNFVPNFNDNYIELKGKELWAKLDRMETRYGGILKHEDLKNG